MSQMADKAREHLQEAARLLAAKDPQMFDPANGLTLHLSHGTCIGLVQLLSHPAVSVVTDDNPHFLLASGMLILEMERCAVPTS